MSRMEERRQTREGAGMAGTAGDSSGEKNGFRELSGPTIDRPAEQAAHRDSVGGGTATEARGSEHDRGSETRDTDRATAQAERQQELQHEQEKNRAPKEES